MDPENKRFLFELLETSSPSGFEQEGQKRWAAHVRKFADTVENDSYGNCWATLSGKADAPRIMLEAHADEIGFMVRHVSAEGFIYLTGIGGSDAAVARGKRVTLFGSKGPVLGIIGNTAIHLRERKEEKAPALHELFVDIGAKDQQEVAARGIRVGHPCVYIDQVEEIAPGRLIGRALDNRISGFVIAKVLEALSKKRPAAEVVAVNAVQEEIGGHGARMIAYRLQPSIAVVLDVTHATDSPGIEKTKHGEVKLGGGPTLTHGTANHPLLVARLEEIAKSKGIPLQHESSSRHTGTDADDIYTARGGIPTALVSLPLRYMHSTVEMLDIADVEQTIALLEAFVLSVQPGDNFSVRF